MKDMNIPMGAYMKETLDPCQYAHEGYYKGEMAMNMTSGSMQELRGHSSEGQSNLVDRKMADKTDRRNEAPNPMQAFKGMAKSGYFANTNNSGKVVTGPVKSRDRDF